MARHNGAPLSWPRPQETGVSCGWGRKRGRGRDVPRPGRRGAGIDRDGCRAGMPRRHRAAAIQACILTLWPGCGTHASKDAMASAGGPGRRRGARSCRTIAAAESRGRGREHGPRETFGRRASCASAPQVDPGAWTVGRGRGVPSGRTVTRRFSGPLRRVVPGRFGVTGQGRPSDDDRQTYSGLRSHNPADPRKHVVDTLSRGRPRFIIRWTRMRACGARASRRTPASGRVSAHSPDGVARPFP